jgi:uncharacterized membrane protein YccC
LTRLITIASGCLCASLLAAGVATAGNQTSNEHASNLAAKQCTAMQKADASAFRARYGEHAMRNCIHRTTNEVSTELKNATKECKAARQADPEGFRQTYGSNHNGQNALGKCVSKKVNADIKDDTAAFKNAAKACKAARQADPAGFQQTYGSNHNGRNALGKCVSSKVKHQD